MIVIKGEGVGLETENDPEAGVEDALEVGDVGGTPEVDPGVGIDLGTDQGTFLDPEVVQRAEADQDPILDIEQSLSVNFEVIKILVIFLRILIKLNSDWQLIERVNII